MKGLHLLADLSDCIQNTYLLDNSIKLKNKCLGLIEGSGLTVIRHIFHKFEPQGITGIIILAESHVALHTWPEKNALTLDIYVCNYTTDNEEKAMKLLTYIVETFKPEKTRFTTCNRGE
jgi:S-adenosylmethionine decarboxylase proenzyme